MNFPIVVPEKSREAYRKVYKSICASGWVSIRGSFCVINARSMVIKETLHYPAFIICISGAAKNIMTIKDSQ